MKFVSHRNNSRINWGEYVDGDQNNNYSDIKLGCILRIADATEAMAKNHVALQRELDYLSNRVKEKDATIERISRSNAALRGTITRMKRAVKGGAK